MSTLVISDLHLQEDRPDITGAFLRFLGGPARDAKALYILGDLFESWIGDDDDSALAAEVQAALRQCTESGIVCHVMHGNRDFLIGERFAAATGVILLDDPTVVDLHGLPTLLMHGDTLCTGDAAYLAFRAQVRDPAWQARFLSQPIEARRVFAWHAREQSRLHTGRAAAELMDVTPAAVVEAMRKAGVTRLIHGHTHRPGTHSVEIPGLGHAKRIVLGDWDRGAYALVVTAGACRPMTGLT